MKSMSGNDLGSSQNGGRGTRGLTRRGFLATVGASAVAVNLAGAAADNAASKGRVIPASQHHAITLDINGKAHPLLVEARWTLLFVLREKLGLTGAKAGCERGECGACTVLMDGIPRYACMTLAVEAEGKKIETVEGLMDGEELGAVQRAFAEEDAFQCGYCTPGQIMAAEGLLRTVPEPGFPEIQKGMSGNLCRCGAYAHIFRAVQKAAFLKKEKSGRQVQE